MPEPFAPTPDGRKALQALADQIPGVQQTLIKNDSRLKRPDRAAHQQQIAGGKVLLKVTAAFPKELEGLGLFQAESAAVHGYVGIGRISTGLGCPHLETDPDFLGLMLAFRTSSGARIDFITINDPTAPTRTPEEFVALLKATADAAGTTVPHGSAGDLGALNVVASQAELLLGLAKHAGLRAPAIAGHVVRQTARTLLSSTAYQQYWTGVVRARDTFGKFTMVPTADVNVTRAISPGQNYLSADWARRQSAGPLDFTLYWIPYVNEGDTPMGNLTAPWRETHRVAVGSLSFPMTDPASMDAKMTALLASEMGANPGHWIESPGQESTALPATEYTAARSLVYRVSQRERDALAEAVYESFFERGELSRELKAELIRRYGAKRAMGHAVPDIGDLAEAAGR